MKKISMYIEDTIDGTSLWYQTNFHLICEMEDMLPRYQNVSMSILRKLSQSDVLNFDVLTSKPDKGFRHMLLIPEFVTIGTKNIHIGNRISLINTKCIIERADIGYKNGKYTVSYFAGDNKVTLKYENIRNAINSRSIIAILKEV